MKSASYFLLLSLVIVCSSGCGKQPPPSIEAYYYPLHELQKGLAYEYRAIGQDSLAPDLWYYKSTYTDTANYLLKAYFRQDNSPQQLSREEIVGNGALLQQLRIFEWDSLGQNHEIEATIVSPNAFPFEIENKNMIYLYKVHFQLPSQPHGRTTLIINRHFLGDTTYQYQGKDYPAIYFDTRGQVLVRDSINGDIEPRFWGEEIYAKGLGLVAYRRAFSPDERGLEYQLVDRYSMKVFEDAVSGE